MPGNVVGLNPGTTLVTGATGLLGGCVVSELIGRGAPRVLVGIRAKAGESAVDRFEAFQRAFDGCDQLELADLSGPGPPRLPAETESIIHCAAQVDFARDEGAIEANVAATWDLLCAASSASALRRFVHVSSLTIRADSPQPFTEADLDVGQVFVSPYTLTKFLTEVMIQKFHRPVPVTVVRAGTVLPTVRQLDRTSTDWFRNTVALWARGRLRVVPMAPGQPLYPITADDLAEVLVLLAATVDAPPVVHLPSHPGPPASAVFASLAAALDRPAPALLGQHTAAWRASRAEMPAVVGRVIDGLYPPPPVDHRLAIADSSATARWLEEVGFPDPSVDDTYWTALAMSTEPSVRPRRTLTPSRR